MSDPITIGMGAGALGSLMMGGSPIKGAALGGLAGTGYGAFTGTGAAANLFGGATATGAPLAGATGVAGTPTAAFLAPTAPEIGMANSFNLATNAPLVGSEGAGYLGSTGELGANMGLVNAMPVANTSENLMLATRPYQEGGLAGGAASSGSSILDSIKPYANIQNLSGAKSLYDQYNKPQQMIQAPAGRITEGKIPQGGDVMSLIASMKPKERKHISLL